MLIIFLFTDPRISCTPSSAAEGGSPIELRSRALLQRTKKPDARPSSSKGKGDGYAKGDEEVVKPDLPHVSAGLPGDGITHINDDGREVKIDKAGRPYPVGKDGFRLMKTTRPPEYTPTGIGSYLRWSYK